MPEAHTHAQSDRELTFAQAIREALAEEMRRDPTVFILGEDVAEAGTPFKVLSGLLEEFGKNRVLDTPISEAGFTGLAVGAAMTGMRPVVDIMFGDFVTLTMDQMVNQAAKVHYMSGGKWRVPMVMRTTMGATRRSAAQHSQSLHAWFCHVPGLKVVLPSTPYDAKGLLKAAIRDENPVVFFEDKMMYKLKGSVPAGDYTVPLGVADVKRLGEDITLGRHQQHGASGTGRSDIARGNRNQRRSRRSAHLVAARRKNSDRIGEENFARNCSRRRLRTLRRHRRTCVGDRHGRILRPGRSSETHGRNARSNSVFAAIGRRNGTDGANGLRSRAETVRKIATSCERACGSVAVRCVLRGRGYSRTPQRVVSGHALSACR